MSEKTISRYCPFKINTVMQIEPGKGLSLSYRKICNQYLTNTLTSQGKLFQSLGEIRHSDFFPADEAVLQAKHFQSGTKGTQLLKITIRQDFFQIISHALYSTTDSIWNISLHDKCLCVIVFDFVHPCGGQDSRPCRTTICVKIGD